MSLVRGSVYSCATRVNERMDHGFMHGRSFCELDGHLWEVMWMSAATVEQGPADMVQTGLNGRIKACAGALRDRALSRA